MSVRPGADYLDYERAQLKIPASGLKFDVVLEPLGQGELSGWMTSRKAARCLKPIHIPSSKFRVFYYRTSLKNRSWCAHAPRQRARV